MSVIYLYIIIAEHIFLFEMSALLHFCLCLLGVKKTFKVCDVISIKVSVGKRGCRRNDSIPLYPISCVSKATEDICESLILEIVNERLCE